MFEKTLSYKKYNLSLEVLTGLCTGGGENGFYSSDEYFISNGRVYFINIRDIVKLNKNGLLSNDEVKNWYSIIEKGEIREELKRELKSIPLKTKYNNKLNIHKIAYIKKLEDDCIKEVPVIMGSTIKGLFRHGFDMSKIESVKYEYKRDKKKLKFLGIKKINNHETYKKDANYKYIRKMSESEYIPDKINGNKENAIMCFRNTIFNDIILESGNMSIEKVLKWSRKKRKYVIPQYYETVNRGGVFKGEIIYKLKDDKTPIDIAFQNLKKYYKKVIEIEENLYVDKKYSKDIYEFYNVLKEENQKENTLVCKLGYSGAISKTLIPFESIKTDKLFPYTLNVLDSDKLPFGWVKINLEETKDED